MGAVASATLFVGDASQLCAVQTETRRLCRSVGFKESAVFDSVIAVTELAHSLFIETATCGLLELTVVRRGGRLGLEVRAESVGARPAAALRLSLAFPIPVPDRLS
jgi:hypothetical protein